MRERIRKPLALVLILAATTGCSPGGAADGAPSSTTPTSTTPTSTTPTSTTSTSATPTSTASTAGTRSATPNPAAPTPAAASPSAARDASRAATPAPTVAGDLTASVFAATMDRWRAVPGEGDEGSYQTNGSWVHALAPEQVVQGLAMQRCAETGALPAAAHVLASDYKDAQGRRAVGMALRFSSARAAAAFVGAYGRAVASCVGATNPMSATIIERTPALVDRRVMLADGTRWVELVRAHATLVRMFVANEQDQPLTAAHLSALATRV